MTATAIFDILAAAQRGDAVEMPASKATVETVLRQVQSFQRHEPSTAEKYAFLIDARSLNLPDVTVIADALAAVWRV